jgi:hypothetical protein
MIRCSVLALLVALLSCTLSVSATAGEGRQPPTAEQRREAKRLFNQAHLAYEDADYEGAILKWKRSYELSGEPLIFEAIAKAYEKLGDATKAYENLSQWREHAPAAEQERLDRRLAALETRIAAEQERVRKEQERRRLEEERRKAREEAERRKREEQDSGRQSPPPPDDGAALSGTQIASWTMIGVGAAAVVAGIVVDAVAASSRPDEETACSAQGDELLCRAALQDDIESSNTLAIAGDITWIAGGAIAATGLVLLLTIGDDEGGSEPAAKARLSPSLGPAGTGFTLSGSF